MGDPERDERATVPARPASRDVPSREAPRPAASAFDPGDHRFEARGELGRGGMGHVDDAFDTALGRSVAIKHMLSAEGVDLARFEREARITARLEHPGIVPIHDAGRGPDGTPCYVMRRVDGQPLAELVAGKSLVERLELIPNVLAAAMRRRSRTRAVSSTATSSRTTSSSVRSARRAAGAAADPRSRRSRVLEHARGDRAHVDDADRGGRSAGRDLDRGRHDAELDRGSTWVAVAAGSDKVLLADFASRVSFVLAVPGATDAVALAERRLFVQIVGGRVLEWDLDVPIDPPALRHWLDTVTNAKGLPESDAVLWP